MDVQELSLDQLESADSVRQVVPVDVPEWGGRVHVRELTALERDRLDAAYYQEGGTEPDVTDYRARVVALTLCRADGTPYFSPGPAAVQTIARKSAAAVRRVFNVAARLNKLRKEDADAGKAGSGGAPAAGSPSASPSPPAAST